MKPSFITRSLQAVRGALQLTVSVPKQKTQMNKLTAFCQQVRGIGKSEKQREHERERKGYEIRLATFRNVFQPTVELHKNEEESEARARKVDKDFAVAFNRKLEVVPWLSANR